MASINGDGCSDPERQKFEHGLIELMPFLRSFARSIVGNAELAEDLAQETLVKAWGARLSFEDGTNLKAWLFTIMRNQFYSDRRRAWRQVPWDQDAAEDVPLYAKFAMPEQQASSELKELMAAMATLSYEQEQALILVGYDGRSYEEAAQLAGCAVGTVKSRVARARRALLGILGYDAVEFASESGLSPKDSAWEKLVRDGGLEADE